MDTPPSKVADTQCKVEEAPDTRPSSKEDIHPSKEVTHSSSSRDLILPKAGQDTQLSRRVDFHPSREAIPLSREEATHQFSSKEVTRSRGLLEGTHPWVVHPRWEDTLSSSPR